MSVEQTDVLLVGAGTMSATLGSLLNELDPSLNIVMVEALDDVGRESSDGWNNAGTGHAGYCELNYTPMDDQGQIDAQKAFNVNTAFEISLQFWSHLVEQEALPEPTHFINPTPHLSFVWGEGNVDFLRQRHALLSQHHLFADMEFSDDPETLTDWMPLIMADRNTDEPVAATRVPYGTDVDFGSLTRYMVDHLSKTPSFSLRTHTRVKDLKQSDDGRWSVRLQDTHSGERSRIKARFVFLGAGGGALPLLHKSEIEEAHGYGGFPVSGQWLKCSRPEVVEQHHSKVYGKAEVGAPPMSVPHLDTRTIDGERSLLFGPFAGFTTKFLKKGSVFDLPGSLHAGNLRPMMNVGFDNMPLTFYLMREALQSQGNRMAALRRYYPNARDEDWTLETAGQRVQVIKKDKQKGGKLEFGTELVIAKDRTLAALLGASPGASTATRAMLDVIERCFTERMEQGDWQSRLQSMIPSYGKSLQDDADLTKTVRTWTYKVLRIDP